MRLFILGATGKTGVTLVAQALARGHTVTTFGRSQFTGDATRRITGNPMNITELVAALPDHDAVLSVIGARGLGRSSVRADAARATVAAMTIARVPRLIIVSSALLDTNGGWLPRFLSRTLLRSIPPDQRAMEAAVMSAGIDWTILRPPMTNNGPLTRRYEVIPGSEPGDARRTKMSRSDVAHMMLEIAESGAHPRQIVWIRGTSS
jgi:putative NADH-flavin reductase